MYPSRRCSPTASADLPQRLAPLLALAYGPNRVAKREDPDNLQLIRDPQQGLTAASSLPTQLEPTSSAHAVRSID
jgi:hypothetical protein